MVYGGYVSGNANTGSAAAGAAMPSNPWDRIKARLASRVSPQDFQNWVMRAVFEAVEDRALLVKVPDQVTKEWMEQEYTEEIRHAIHELNLAIDRIVYLPSIASTAASMNTAADNTNNAAEPIFASASGQLNPKFRFDSYVVGSSNQFANAAARAVANSPSRSYNPLFIYGGVGMGKTHLMHAIGRDLLDRYPSMRIVYTSSERFMNEMVNCIRSDRMPAFHRHYRSADVLLVDDIQILAGKERTQEEFFHTFNALHESMKQIVIASDRPPKELAEVEDRLRSRFEWGLIADIQPPDLETKVAILQKKSEQEKVTLPTDVALYIASNIRSNVRELEGALIRLVAHSSLIGAEITLAYTQQVLKNFIDSQARKVTIESIQKAVAEQFGLRLVEIKAKNNSRSIVYPRQIAMYLAKHMTEASLPEIGRQFGGKHHTTVLHSVEKIDTVRKTDKDLNRLLNKMTEQLGG